MSAVAIPPPTKPHGFRPPPIPPVTTTFDGSPSSGGDRYHEFLLADAADLLRKFYRRHLTDDVAVTDESWWLALNGRHKLLTDELLMFMLSEDLSLPPEVLFESFAIEGLDFNDLWNMQSRFESMVEQLEGALRDLNFDSEVDEWLPPSQF